MPKISTVLPHVHATKAVSCESCRLHKKKCTKERGGCERCLDKGLCCIYIGVVPVQAEQGDKYPSPRTTPPMSSQQQGVKKEDGGDWLCLNPSGSDVPPVEQVDALWKRIHAMYSGKGDGCVRDVVASREGVLLTGDLLNVYASIPDLFLVHPRTLGEQMCKVPIGQWSVVLGMNLQLLGCASYLNRSKLFLATKGPSWFRDVEKECVLAAVEQCLDVAIEICEFLRMGGMWVGREKDVEGAVMEALVVLWFVSCRMDREWVDGLDVVYVRNRAKLLVEYLRMLGTGRQAVQAMWEEMNGMTSTVWLDRAVEVDALEVSLLGMEVGPEGRRVRIRGEERWHLLC